MPGPSNSRAIGWLRGELPGLVQQGVLTAEAAAALEQHYAVREEKGGSSFGFVLLATIGSALIGAGIILLIAHNWDDLSRTTRCVLAFLPLVVAILLGGFVLARRDDSPAWRESVAIFDIASAGASIALVSQIFQIQGSFADFMNVWLFLSIPVVYLFRSRVAELAYITGTAVWMTSMAPFWGYNPPGRLLFWLLLLLVIPFFIADVRQFPSGWMHRTLSLALVVAAAIGVGATVELAHSELGGPAFAGLFALIYLIGMIRQGDPNAPLTTFTVLGGLGIAATSVIFSFTENWDFSDPIWVKDPTTEQQFAIAIALAFPILSILLAGWCLTKGKTQFSWLAAALPLVALLARLFFPLLSNPAQHHSQLMDSAAFLFNVYTLALGVEFLIRGIRADSLVRANFGLLVVAVLALCRFFDSDLSFVVRGLGFIVVGAAFLVGNLVLFRRQRAA